jgi:hypothetical protein
MIRGIMVVFLVFIDAMESSEEEVCVSLDGEECFLSFVTEEDFMVTISLLNTLRKILI